VVRFVSAESGTVLFESSGHPVQFSDRLATQYFVLRFEEIALQKPGEYWIELWCEGVFLDDAVLRVAGEVG
jgi:hypothetical protein